ncbi:MAG: nitroreductase family protein [Nanoarchaeota archaeon]
MEFDEVIKKRRSVRSFLDKKPAWKDVLEAIDFSSQGPFAGNHNNIKFLIIENKDMLRELSNLAGQLWISESQIAVLVCSDDTNLENVYGERGRVYSRQQAGATIGTFLLKLVDLGLSACWVGSYDDLIVKQKLKIPENVQIEAIIPIGYADETKNVSKVNKKSLESSLFWENWGESRRMSLFEEEHKDIAPLGDYNR